MRPFQSQQVTTANRSAVWAVWKDVSRWPEWDTELEAASLHGPFVTGAVGSLMPKRGPRSPFALIEVTEGAASPTSCGCRWRGWRSATTSLLTRRRPSSTR